MPNFVVQILMYIIYESVSISFWTESITKYTLTLVLLVAVPFKGLW